MSKVTAVIELERNEQLGFTQGTVKFPDEYDTEEQIGILATMLHGAGYVTAYLDETEELAQQVFDVNYAMLRNMLDGISKTFYQAISTKRGPVQYQSDTEIDEPGVTFLQFGNEDLEE